MRDIEFRAKRISDGEWVHGNLFISDVDGKTHILCGSRRVTIEHEVDPGTVGQYTGLKDKNGKQIFEGDIAKFENILFEVKWDKCEWIFGHVKGQAYCYPYFATHAEMVEVIGNIHDNQKILETTT